MKKTFKELMVIADRLAAGQNRLKDTILKEVLHADILMALHQSELGKSLVFQGGTALRLCYGNQRYSEDLDFVRNAPLNPAHFENFKKALTTSIAERHELTVRVTDPKRSLDARSSDNSVVVHRWTATIEISSQEETDIPGAKNQKIHIEVADIPAYDARPRMINSPYAHLGTTSVMLNVSSEKEILADKVIAVAGRNHIKARDIWDIKWLRDKGVALNLDWVRQKALDHHLVTGSDMSPLVSRLQRRTQDLALPATHKHFVDEMSRFLAMEQANIWLSDDYTSLGLIKDVSDFLEEQLSKLEAPVMTPDQSTHPAKRAQEINEWRQRMTDARKGSECQDNDDPQNTP